MTLHIPTSTLCDLEFRWSLRIEAPFVSADVTSSWVAPVTLPDGAPAVLKLGMPHFEAVHELQGLRFWDGDPTVKLLRADEHLNAMLLERCEPGTSLRTLTQPHQDVVIARLLRRLWRIPSPPHPFRPLSSMLDCWGEETLAQVAHWPDPGLVRLGLQLFHDLSRNASSEALLATDLHAGNVLRSAREPWLVIDPKPFIGDPTYDATQHLFNCMPRLRRDPSGTICRLADLAGLDAARLRLWAFARAAAEPRANWTSSPHFALAKTIAP